MEMQKQESYFASELRERESIVNYGCAYSQRDVNLQRGSGVMEGIDQIVDVTLIGQDTSESPDQ